MTANNSTGLASYILTSSGSSANVYWSVPNVPRISTQASATSITIDPSLYDQYVFTALAAGLTFNASTTGSPTNGRKMVIRIKDNGTARALTWASSGSGYFRPIGLTLPTTTTTSKVIYVGCVYNSDDITWDVIAYSVQA